MRRSTVLSLPPQLGFPGLIPNYFVIGPTKPIKMQDSIMAPIITLFTITTLNPIIPNIMREKNKY